MDTSPIILVAWAAFGAVFGSFGNVVIWRFPRGESVSAPASSCPSCGHPIRWYDNVPVLSWAVLGARCRDCGARISARYPLVETLSALAFLAAAVRFRADAGVAVAAAAFLWALLVLAFVDLDTMRLPNAIVGALAAAGAAGAVFSQVTGLRVVPLAEIPISGPLSAPLASAVAGALLGAGPIWLVGAGYQALRKREGLGMGDVKLLGAMGLVLGPYVLVALLVGTLLAVAGRLVSALAGRGGLGERSPFGPYLAAGGVAAALAGPQLLGWYLHVLGQV